MAVKKATQTTYNIHAHIQLYASVNITANSFEEAAALAKDLKVGDFVDILGDHLDSESPKITGIFTT